MVICWFSGVTSNDNVTAKTFTYPYSYTTTHYITVKTLSASVTDSNYFRMYSPLVVKLNNSQSIIHYYVDHSYVATFDAIVIGY